MLGKAIKAYIQQQKITQEQFADSIGVSSRMLRHFIAGTKIPSTVMLKRISRITGVSMDELTEDIN